MLLTANQAAKEPSMSDQPMFDAPETYQATIPLRAIKPLAPAAPSATKRSLDVFGQLTAPLLREIHSSRRKATDGVLYEIVDGARRIADLREADPEGSVYAVVLPHSVSPDTARAMSLSLNMNRAANPVIEAERLGELRDAGISIDDMAKLIGLNRTRIRDRLALIDGLVPELWQLARHGHIKVGVAKRASRLSRKAQSELYEMHKAGEIEHITHDVVSELQNTARDRLVDSASLFEAESLEDPTGNAREALRMAISTGIDREALLALVDELFEARDAR